MLGILSCNGVWQCILYFLKYRIMHILLLSPSTVTDECVVHQDSFSLYCSLESASTLNQPPAQTKSGNNMFIICTAGLHLTS